jgi:hypothetical protein
MLIMVLLGKAQASKNSESKGRFRSTAGASSSVAGPNFLLYRHPGPDPEKISMDHKIYHASSRPQVAL